MNYEITFVRKNGLILNEFHKNAQGKSFISWEEINI